MKFNILALIATLSSVTIAAYPSRLSTTYASSDILKEDLKESIFSYNSSVKPSTVLDKREVSSFARSTPDISTTITYSSQITTTNTTEHSASCEVLIKLFAVYKASDGSRTGITNYHEGAGINYLFFTGNDSPNYIYNRCTKQVYSYFSGDMKLWLSELDGFVQLSVTGPNGVFTIDNEKLSVNGSPDGWVGCYNTNDPYNYSKNLRQLAHVGTQFTNCTPVWVYVDYSY